MINKQNLWFLTLFSLILVLSIYYITMPNDLLKSKDKGVISDEAKGSTTETIEELNGLVAMRVNLEEERQNEIDALQQQLAAQGISVEEKNNLYEQLKYLNGLQGKEETFEKTLKDKYKLDCFVKIDNSNVGVVCISDKHDNSLANNIMRLIQDDYKDKMYITVKFQKK